MVSARNIQLRVQCTSALNVGKKSRQPLFVVFSGGEKLDDQPPSEELPLISEEFGQLEISECEMEEWLTADQDVMGFQELSDGEILDLVQESPSPQDDTDEEEEQEKCVNHGDVKQCFDTCFKWLEQ